MDAVGRTVGTRVCFLRGMRSLHAGPALAFSQMIDERVAMYYVQPAIFVVILRCKLHVCCNANHGFMDTRRRRGREESKELGMAEASEMT